MPYKDPEKQAAYLRKWREKRRNARFKQARKAFRLFLFLYSSNNPRNCKKEFLQFIPLVFNRFLTRDEEELLWGFFKSLPQRFLEAAAIAWRESCWRNLTVFDFEDIFFRKEEDDPVM